MTNNFSNIMPVTKAREKLGDLAEKVTGENYIVLTKGGFPKAAIVDISYLNKLQQEVRKIYQKTYIEPALIKYTRDFSDKEIDEWQKQDQL